MYTQRQADRKVHRQVTHGRPWHGQETTPMEKYSQSKLYLYFSGLFVAETMK